MKIFIEKAEITSYRSCKRTKFSPDQKLSALIGANGSGKTNLLQGLLLLKKIARLPRFQHQTRSSLSGCRLKAVFNVNGQRVMSDAIVKYVASERNIDNVIDATQRWNFESFTGEKVWIKLPLSLPFESPHFRETVQQMSGTERGRWLAKYTELLAGVKLPAGTPFDKIYPILKGIADFAIGIKYYGASQFTDPSRCPVSFEIEKEQFHARSFRQGQEHLHFMFELYSAYKANKPEFEEFKSIVCSEGIGLIDSIRYDEITVPSSIYEVVAGGRVIRKVVKKLLVIPNFVIRGGKLSPNQLSEGTFKTLAIVFHLITDKTQLLLLEEPEVCVHHGLLASILEIVKTFSRKKQIIITTHSDLVLDALDPENVFIVRNDRQAGTTIRHVPTSMSRKEFLGLKNYLRESGNLGEYWRHGELER